MGKVTRILVERVFGVRSIEFAITWAIGRDPPVVRLKMPSRVSTEAVAYEKSPQSVFVSLSAVSSPAEDDLVT